MNKNVVYLLLFCMVASIITSCKKDDWDYNADGYTISSHENDSDSDIVSVINNISIAYSDAGVTVNGDESGMVSVSGNDVTITSLSYDSLVVEVSGSTSDGSLLIFRQDPRRFRLRLNGVSITNNDGPAINNQCKRKLYLEVVDGTVNTLVDGVTYTERDFDQKGTLFSEGQIYFSGTGRLSVEGHCKNAIACDDYIVIDEAEIQTYSTAGNGIKVNDGLWMYGGSININVESNGGRGIKCDSTVTISGGNAIIYTSGDCVYDTDEQDYSSAACIKCDYDFTMTGGTLEMTSTGDGGKGINCSTKVVFSGGTLTATTTGSNNNGKPKAVKGDAGIIVSGGTFKANVDKSWACDNGSESETPEDHITVVGSPKSATITKKSVEITY